MADTKDTLAEAHQVYTEQTASAKQKARTQLREAMASTEEETSEETAETPETNDTTSEQEVEPVEKTEEVEEVDQEASEESEESPQEEESVDEYKAALEAERARRERAEKKILKLKREKDGEVEPPAPQTQPDVNEVVEAARRLFREEVELTRAEEVNEIIDDTLGSMTENASERELILEHYNNTINRSGSTRGAIQRDLQRARLLANENKLVSENSELKAALKSKRTASSAPEFSGKPMRPSKRVKLSGADEMLLNSITRKSKGKISKEAILKKLK